METSERTIDDKKWRYITYPAVYNRPDRLLRKVRKQWIEVRPEAYPEIVAKFRHKNPTKTQIKTAAKNLAKKAGSLAWRGAKFGGRVGAAGAKAAASEVKRSFCRQRNPAGRFYEIRMGKSSTMMALQWTTATVGDAKFIAKTFAKAYPKNFVSVKRVR